MTAAAVLVAGTLLGRAILGADDGEARSRIQTEVRGAFDVMTHDLQDAAALAQSPAVVRKASNEDQAASVAASSLFKTASTIVESRAPRDMALTIYDADDRPLAWAGRPTELPAERLRARETWLLTPGELGLRLVYVTGIEQDGTALGRIAVERPLEMLAGDRSASLPAACDARDTFCFPTRLGPVTVQLPAAGP